MKRIIIPLFVLICSVTMAQNINVITYNIRYNNPDDGINAWPNRSQNVAALLRFHCADIFGLQEALIGQIEDIQARLPQMKWIGAGRDDGKKAGEFSPVFYNAQKFKALKSGWFWLSEHPEKPGLGWDAACNRICTWVLLQSNETKRQFLFFNTHFDHRGDKARIESAKLILQKIREINTSGIPVILTGDFNLTSESEPLKLIMTELKDSRAVSSEAPYGPEGTFNDFKFDSPLNERIDFVFVNKQVVVNRYGVLTDSKDQRYFSDHLPVLVNIGLGKGR